jgi:hypothetical protein
MPCEASVVSTSATRHYGVSALATYEPQVDKDQPTKVDPSTGITRCLRVSVATIFNTKLSLIL